MTYNEARNSRSYKDAILKEAVALAVKFTLGGVTREKVAESTGCAVGTVNYHFKSMAELRKAILAHAIQHENIPLLALYAGNPKIARRLTPELKQRVAAHIAR